jgi:hypothetical protein
MESLILNPEEMIRPFLNYLTFVIDVIAGIVIVISIIRGFIMFLKILRRSPLEQTKEEEGIKRCRKWVDFCTRLRSR